MINFPFVLFFGYFFQWGFFKTDKNKNGLVESSEAITGRWSLRGSIPCKLSFIQECDEDTSGSVSRQEWLNCFKIQGECQVTCILRWQIERQCFDPRGRGGGGVGGRVLPYR